MAKSWFQPICWAESRGDAGFARAFAAVGEETKKGFAAYVAAVRARKYPK